MKLKTVIVEDEKNVAVHIRSILRRLGHEVVGMAADGQTALQLVRKKGCDLLIADIRIDGETDGIVTAKNIRRLCECSVVFITAHRDTETLERAADVEHEGYLVKPFREEELETIVSLIAIRSKKRRISNRMLAIDDVYTYCRDCETLFQNRERVNLTEKERRFLLALLEAKDGLVPHEYLTETVWNGENIDPNTRRQLIHRFKRKVPFFPLKLVKGFGYQIDMER